MDFDLRQILVGFLAIVTSVTFHEFAHAIVADKLGDPTPREHGRITLNPVVIMKAHPFGALIVPLFGAIQGFLVGWAATPVNPRLARKTSMRTAHFLIAVAGPLSNGLLGLLSVTAFVLLFPHQEAAWAEPFYHFSFMMVVTNIILAILNILPIPPLDGFSVLESKAPVSWEKALGFLRQYGLILLLLVFLYFGKIIDPVLRWFLGKMVAFAAGFAG